MLTRGTLQACLQFHVSSSRTLHELYSRELHHLKTSDDTFTECYCHLDEERFTHDDDADYKHRHHAFFIVSGASLN